MNLELNKQEKAAISSLKRLAKRWPNTLWIFAGDKGLDIMKINEAGRQAMTAHGGVDSQYKVDNIDIKADGGAW